LVRARLAKISRISSLRSMTFRSQTSSSSADLGRREVVVEDDHIRLVAFDGLGELTYLALAM